MQSNNNYCNNCGKIGHVFNLCKMPITSIGIIAFRKNEVNEIQYLMIRRKDTLGHIDFIRGKYSVKNKHYILNMLNQMTEDEKTRIKEGNFDELWNHVWCDEEELSPLYKNEEVASRQKFNDLLQGIEHNGIVYNLHDLIEESRKQQTWTEPEWGFPKGRRNNYENDYDCALREFEEETGIKSKQLINIQNIIPFEEIFTGSNYKSYKHKYYIMNIRYENTIQEHVFQKSEVSKLEWKNVDQCLEVIRDYNCEKKKMFKRIDNCLQNYILL